MVGKIQNNINFTSLKISQDNDTKKAIVKYVDCMDTMRVMADSFEKTDKATGDSPIVIRGTVVSDVFDKSKSKIVIEALDERDAKNTQIGDKSYKPIASINICDKSRINRSELVEQFCNTIEENNTIALDKLA